MNSTERVRAAILGKEYDRQPIYGWVYANLTEQITERFGSVAAFEDRYEFDAAHIFGAPRPWDKKLIEKIASENDELTPDLLLEENIFTDPTRASYEKRWLPSAAMRMRTICWTRSWTVTANRPRVC